jgi:hypothetical protein
LQKKENKRKQLHRAEIPDSIFEKYGIDRTSSKIPSKYRKEVLPPDINSPPKRERGRRGRASFALVLSYIKVHHMDQLGFDVKPMTFYHDNELISDNYYPPIPSNALEHIVKKLNDHTLPRIIRRRFQRVIQKIPIATILPDDSVSEKGRLGIIKTMHIEEMVSSIDRNTS